MPRKIAVEIVGDSSSLTRAFTRSSRAARSWNKDIRQTSRGAIAATVGFSGLGRALALGSGGFLASAAFASGIKKSIEGFTSFQDTMQKTVGLASVAQTQVKGLTKEILALAPAVGKSPQELAEAFYFIASSGIAAKDAVDVLKSSAQGAVAGLGDTAAVADAVTSVLNAYGQANISAAQATDVLVATVREGKGEAAAFAPVIGNVVALASQLGVSFDQVGAALAAQTRLGTDAETTAIQLQRIFSTLLKVTPKSAEAFESVGLNADKLREQLGSKGLLFVLKTVKQAFGDNIPALSQAFGDVRGFRGLLNLVGKQAAQTEQVFNKLANSAGATKQAFDAIDKDAAQQFRKLKASAEVLGISLGALFTPLAVKGAQALTKVVQDFTKFTDKIGRAKGFEAKLNVVTTGIEGLGSRLTKAIVAEYQKIDFAAAGRAAGDKLSDAFDAIRRKIDTIDWESLGKRIVRDIATFLKSVDWVRVFSATFQGMRTALQAGGRLLVGMGEELIGQLLKGMQVGAKLALLFVEKFATELVKKMAGATSFLGKFDPFKGVKEKAARRIKEIQAEIDSLTGKTVEIVIDTKVTSDEHGRGPRSGDTSDVAGAKAKAAGKTEADVADTVADARAQAAAAAKRAAAKAKKAREQAIKAFAALTDSFSLKEEIAASTKSLQDDIQVQKDLQAAIRREIAIEGQTTDLMRQLFQSQQKVADFQKQQAEARRQQRQSNQFEALGLTSEGEEKLAGNKTLQKRTNNLRELIKGTVLDTPKTNSQLTRISKILSGKFGKVGREVRAAIVAMLDDIKGALDGGDALKGPLTATSGINTKKIAEGLGLDEVQLNELRGRLSGFNTAGRGITQPTRSPGARSGGFGGDQVPVVESHVTVNIDGQKVGTAVTRSQQRRARRNPPQKRGPGRGGQ